MVTLIPKTKEPDSVMDLCLISLYNVSYKIIAMEITNRLQITLGNIIDPHQSAFIPGRLITDNILLGYERMHGSGIQQANKVSQLSS